MPFCPKCRAEYEVGIVRCSDCDTSLVNALPVEYPKKNPELESAVVYLCSVNNELEAIILRDLLKESGIESSCREGTFIQYPHMLYPNYTGYGMNDIMVLDKDYKAAKQIAEDYLKNIETREKEEKSEEER